MLWTKLLEVAAECGRMINAKCCFSLYPKCYVTSNAILDVVAQDAWKW